jgi:hypothetical protein
MKCLDVVDGLATRAARPCVMEKAKDAPKKRVFYINLRIEKERLHHGAAAPLPNVY